MVQDCSRREQFQLRACLDPELTARVLVTGSVYTSASPPCSGLECTRRDHLNLGGMYGEITSLRSLQIRLTLHNPTEPIYERVTYETFRTYHLTAVLTKVYGAGVGTVLEDYVESRD